MIQRHTPLTVGVNFGDVQDLRLLWKDKTAPQAIITSPPYLDMHDYGNNSKIGKSGQSVSEYLELMEEVLRDCYAIADKQASLWLVVGSIRRKGELILLPHELSIRARKVGWKLREMVTWDKQKALPWTHHGELRDTIEQIILFTKEDSYKFDPTEIRSTFPNSLWWRRYPERYSPMGAMPTNLWNIPIPTQGSWSGIRSHQCPFPEELTYRMLTLTTNPGDTVLDPFAGVGSVPAMAEATGRLGYGLELTQEYIEAYSHTRKRATEYVKRLEYDTSNRKIFHNIIVQLRLLKYAKVLGQSLSKQGQDIAWVKVEEREGVPSSSHQVAMAQFVIGTDDLSSAGSIETKAQTISARPPLSKFGIEAKFLVKGASYNLTDCHCFPSGAFWNAPTTCIPTEGQPHVLAEFIPNPDEIDDIPYA